MAVMTYEGSTSADVQVEPVAMAVSIRATMRTRLSMHAACRTVRDHTGASEDHWLAPSPGRYSIPSVQVPS
jgi:hypothetical protein